MKDEIQKIFEGDIDDSAETLSKYSHDASLFEIRPQMVLFPKHSKDIQNLVLWVKENKNKYPNLSITARCAGTCMSGGSINNSIIIDFTKYMNKVISIGKSEREIMKPLFTSSREVEITGYAVTQPGVFYRDFEPQTFEKGLLLPCYTASKSLNALGGMVGNNSGGELTLRYGKTEDYISELKVVFSDGHEYSVRPITRREIYQKIAEPTFEGKVYKEMFDLIAEHEEQIKNAKPKVTKNSAGYYLWNVLRRGETEAEDIFDLAKLMVGSQGTLGIITEIRWKLVEKIEKSKLLVLFLNDFKKIGEIVDELLVTDPISIESYDDKTFWLAVKFFRDFVKNKGFWSTVRFGLEFLPEVFMTLRGGVPKLIILSEYAGKSEQEINSKAQKAYRVMKKFGLKMRVTKSSQEAEKYWTMRRDSFALLRKHVAGKRTAPFIDDVIVRSEFLHDFLPKINALIQEYPNLVYTIAGHAENGNFHIIPLVDPNDPKLPDTVIELSKRVYDLVLFYEGSIDAEHNDGIVRTPYLNQMYGDSIYALFKKTKSIFDPLNIFNPGKKVGGTLDNLRDTLIQPHRDMKHSS